MHDNIIQVQRTTIQEHHAMRYPIVSLTNNHTQKNKTKLLNALRQVIYVMQTHRLFAITPQGKSFFLFLPKHNDGIKTCHSK